MGGDGKIEVGPTWSHSILYFRHVFKKIVNYKLRSKLITQPNFLSQTHGYHSLRQEDTYLLDILPNVCKDVNTFTQMIVKYVNLFYSVFNMVFKTVQHYYIIWMLV